MVTDTCTRASGESSSGPQTSTKLAAKTWASMSWPVLTLSDRPNDGLTGFDNVHEAHYELR
jgi:hypothetical protein